MHRAPPRVCQTNKTQPARCHLPLIALLMLLATSSIASAAEAGPDQSLIPHPIPNLLPYTLGPLFFTSSERREIELMRRTADAPTTTEQPLLTTLTLNGLSLSPAARRGAWFGHQFIRDGEQLGHYRLQVFNNGALLWDSNHNAIALRVGHSVTIGLASEASDTQEPTQGIQTDE